MNWDRELAENLGESSRDTATSGVITMLENSDLVPGYTLDSELGSGAFARVYLAHQVSLDRKVALKVMNPQLAVDKDLCERFISEARLVARLRHPSIVSIYDTGKYEDNYYISMEYLPGNTLEQYLKNQTFPANPIDIVSQIASALDYAHNHGIVHRDVKPANVLFDMNRRAVLSDFGIAKNLDADVTMTAIGSTMGTPSYMSPEQIRGGSVDGRSDLYSLGVMLFEMLAGVKPFAGTDYVETIMQHLNEPVPKLPKDFSEYQPVVEMLMAKEKEERWESAAEFGEYLEQLRTTGTASGATGHAKSIRSASPKRKRVVMVSAGVLAVAAVGAGTVLNQLRNSSQTPPAGETLEDPTREVEPVILTPQQIQKIESLLEIADLHELVGRIDAPPGANAVDAYRQVLAIDPNNKEASDALARIDSQ